MCKRHMKEKANQRLGSQRNRHFIEFFKWSLYDVSPHMLTSLSGLQRKHAPREDAGGFKPRKRPTYPQRVVKGY